MVSLAECSHKGLQEVQRISAKIERNVAILDAKTSDFSLILLLVNTAETKYEQEVVNVWK